jgi:hypothetical protein
MREIHQEDSDVVDVLVSKKRESLLTIQREPSQQLLRTPIRHILTSCPGGFFRVKKA